MKWEYAFKLLGVDPASLVFVDETGCNLAMAILTAWSLIGVRAFAHRPKSPGPNLTIIGAIGSDGMKAVESVQGAVTGLVFLNWVKTCLAPTLKAGQVVVMDNNSIHKVAGVREAIEARGARLEYLSPYSPEFNPIELAWSKIKHRLSELGARTYDAIWKGIEVAVRSVTEWDALDWFVHCGYGV